MICSNLLSGRPAKLIIGTIALFVCFSQDISQAQNEKRQGRNEDRRDARNQKREVNRNARAVRQDNRQDARLDKRQEHSQNRVTRKVNLNAANARRDDLRDDRRDDRKQSRANVRAQENAQQARRLDRRDDVRDIKRAQNRSVNRWDNGMDNRRRYQTYRNYSNNWKEQRTYLNANMRRFNEIATLNQIQKQQLENQMRDAYRSYHNNSYNGPYGWDNYSEPQFLDYLQNSKPSLLQNILSGFGMGGNDNYLYSNNWNDERSQLARNMGNIHQLSLNGRVTSQQEQTLLNQMRPEFMQYRNNQWNGDASWQQYSDPGFVDYLNKRKPSILTTVRDYLIR